MRFAGENLAVAPAALGMGALGLLMKINAGIDGGSFADGTMDAYKKSQEPWDGRKVNQYPTLNKF